MSNLENFEGYIIFSLINKGSKSEKISPLLLAENKLLFELYFKGDNPFVAESLKKFHLKYCKLKGEINKAKNLITVSEIDEITSPATNFLNANESENNEIDVFIKKEKDDE